MLFYCVCFLIGFISIYLSSLAHFFTWKTNCLGITMKKKKIGGRTNHLSAKQSIIVKLMSSLHCCRVLLTAEIMMTIPVYLALVIA
jgi:hypothetical protein